MSDCLTELELAFLAGLEEKLFSAKWQAEGNNVIQIRNGAIVAECGGKSFWSDFPDVAEFIAAARNALPALLAEVRASRAEISGLETLRAALIRHQGEWSTVSGSPGHIAAMVIMNLVKERDELKARLEKEDA